MTKPLRTPILPDPDTVGAPRPMRRRTLSALGGLVAMAGGCGGSGGTGDLAGVGSGGTGAAFGFGAIAGFGSIIVNGIKYDDSTASVSDDLGNRRGLGDLALGMVVEIRGTADDATSLGVASSIRILSELKGPVTRVTRNPDTPGTGELAVLGMTVRITASTLWQDSAGLLGVSENQTAEVWGFADRGTNTVIATRIELRQGSDEASNRLRGIVTNFVVGSSIRLGGQDFEISPSTSVAQGVGVGMLVKVQFNTSGERRIATKVEVETAATPSNETRVRTDGRISQFISKASFTVEGLSVDASSASFSDGLESQFVDGARVRVDGQMVGGKLKASVVRFKADSTNSSGSGSSGSGSSGSGSGSGSSASGAGAANSNDSYGDEVKGVIVSFSGKESFVVRDAANREFRFNGSSATGKNGGSLPAIGLGSAIEVKFNVQGPGPLIATQIRLDN